MSDRLKQVGTALAKQYETEREILIGCIQTEVEEAGFNSFHETIGDTRDAIAWRACKEYMDCLERVAEIAKGYEPTNPFDVMKDLLELELI